MNLNLTLLIVIGLSFLLCWLFELKAEQDRKTDERTRGNYCVNWRRHDDA